MSRREEFNPKRSLVASREFRFMGRKYAKGDTFPHPDDKPEINVRYIARQYAAAAVDHGEASTSQTESSDSPVQMSDGKRGQYEITAPWLDEPVKVKGKAKAEKQLAAIRDAGQPLGWMAGGSDVTVSGPDDGGWYDVSAPWLDEPERVQGREDAEARQRELHDVGEPESHHGVSLREAQNGYWHVGADWLDEPENVHGAEAARSRADALRADGPPEGWEPAADGSETNPTNAGSATVPESAGTAEGAAEGGEATEGAQTGAGEGEDGGEPAVA